jgi:hypothetical protein
MDMRIICDVEVDIEKARRELNDALSGRSDITDCYDKSVKLDLLIEEYLDKQNEAGLAES